MANKQRGLKRGHSTYFLLYGVCLGVASSAQAPDALLFVVATAPLRTDDLDSHFAVSL